MKSRHIMLISSIYIYPKEKTTTSKEKIRSGRNLEDEQQQQKSISRKEGSGRRGLTHLVDHCPPGWPPAAVATAGEGQTCWPTEVGRTGEHLPHPFHSGSLTAACF